VRSYLASPVISRSGEVLGGLFFGHAQPGVFTDRAERLLVGIAAQAAIAIDNARLYQAAQAEIAERKRTEAALRESEEKQVALNQTLEIKVAERTAELAAANEQLRKEAIEREKIEAALRHSQKMEAVGKLTGGVAHDFNNLLQVIGGNLQLMSKDVAGNERGERRLGNALAGVSRGSKLAAQLLAFGRRQPLAPKVVNLGRFIRGLDDLLRRALGDGIEIETVVSGGLWNSLVDPTQVENALLNLAINARDAMNGHGRLTIEAGNAALDDSYALQHPDVTPGQYVMLAVSDTGCGIPSDVIEHVFEPFFTTKPEGQGTGLGLSMVYGFVKQSDGHIKIYSEPGQGTTVRIYLPRVRQGEDVATEVDAGPITGGSETVLVVEDDDDVRSTVVEMLTDLGYRVLRARDAQSALAIIESGVPVDLLFTDVVMPGPLRSPELARKARERLPGITVLFTSGYTDNAIVHGGRLDEGIELLSKPYTREALARKIRQVLHQQRKPVADGATFDAARAIPGQPAPVTTGLKVLLVDDESLIRSSTAEILSELGHTVHEAGDAAAALAIIEAEAIDVLLTDIGLPGMSGGELAAEARRRVPGLGIVFASGQATVPGAKQDGISDAILLVKPYHASDIATALVKAVRAA
jgi:signal transduction histidine kinase/CheY-like chemotaxis protein